MLCIKNVRIVDVANKNVLENAVILIENGKFAAVGCDVEIPEDANVLNANGMTAIPGLIDAHTHITGTSTFDHPGSGNRVETYDYTEAREGFLKWGVTAARTCGDQKEAVLAFRDAQRNGEILAPRVSACGPFIQAEAGHPWATVFMKDEVLKEHGVVFADTDKTIEEQVADIAALGVDFIKAFNAHINKMDYPNPVPKLTKEQIKRVADAAHSHGLKVAVHVDGCVEMEEVVDAGVDFAEHVIGAGSTDTEYSDELIEKIKNSGMCVDPTLTSIIRFDHMFPTVWEKLKDTVKRFYDAGIPILVGVDSGVPFCPYGESLHDEMAYLAEAGLENMDILRAATYINAKALGFEGMGSIENGKCADLILLGSDPVKDIKATKDIRLVMMDGKVIVDNCIA